MDKRKRYDPRIESISPNDITGMVTNDERVFCYLHAICGMSATMAYYYGNKKSKATLQSCSAPASRLVREPHIIAYIRTLWDFARHNQLEFNEEAIKG